MTKIKCKLCGDVIMKWSNDSFASGIILMPTLITHLDEKHRTSANKFREDQLALIGELIDPNPLKSEVPKIHIPTPTEEKKHE